MRNSIIPQVDEATAANFATNNSSYKIAAQEFYINTDVDRALHITDLALDELEHIVGRFAAHSSRAGLLRGKVVIHADGTVQIRKCFGSKLLWTKESL